MFVLKIFIFYNLRKICILRVFVMQYHAAANIKYPSGKIVHEKYSPETPILDCKTGFYRGLPIFLIFDQKHRLWVLAIVGSIEYPQSVV